MTETQVRIAKPKEPPSPLPVGTGPRQRLLAGLPVVERRLELAGLSTAVLEGGAGPPIVLLHGPGEYAAKWLRVIPELVKSHRVVAPDLPGHGDSEGGGPLDAARVLAWLDELIARTCTTPPVLVGQIIGGAIAARYASTHRDRIDRLVLVDTLGLAPFEPAPEFGQALMSFMAHPTEQSHDDLWQRCAFDLDALRHGMGEAWPRLKAYNLDRARAADLGETQRALMGQFGLPPIPVEELERIAVPTTLIWGRHDLATRLDVAHAASVRFGWPLHVIENAADDPAIEQPVAFLRVLHDVLGDGASRAAWNRIAPGYDRTNTPTQMWLGEESLRIAGLRPGMRFLDVAAGSGALSIPAARLGARVLATDQSSAMLELLARRARAEGLKIETRVMDGHALELDDGSFDMAGSQFGVMLFPDMPRGIREMVRVVASSGRVFLNVYGDPRKVEFLGFLVTAVRSVRPGFTGPPMDPPPLPFQLQDPERLRRELAAAGLREVRVRTVVEATEFRSGDQLWEWLIWSNPIVEDVLAELELTSDEREVVRAALERQIRERANGGASAVLTNPVHIGIGAK